MKKDFSCQNVSSFTLRNRLQFFVICHMDLSSQKYAILLCAVCSKFWSNPYYPLLKVIQKTLTLCLIGIYLYRWVFGGCWYFSSFFQLIDIVRKYSSLWDIPALPMDSMVSASSALFMRRTLQGSISTWVQYDASFAPEIQKKHEAQPYYFLIM